MSDEVEAGELVREPAMSPPARKRLHPHGPLTTVRMLLEIVVIAIFITTFLVQPTRIASGSMYPTLAVGDMLMVDKQAYGDGHGGVADGPLPPERIKRGDVVVFHYDIDPTLLLVKRVVALPGERVHLSAGKVFINDVEIAEPYAFYLPSRHNRFRDEFPDVHDADPNVDPHWWNVMRRMAVDGDVTVPPDKYFVLGDNRNESDDSRYWGFVPRAAIVGRPMLVYFSTEPVAGDTVGERLGLVLGQGWRSFRVVR